jgi:hypothetical protein
LTINRSKIAAHFDSKFIEQSFVGQIQTRMMLFIIANFRAFSSWNFEWNILILKFYSST